MKKKKLRMFMAALIILTVFVTGCSGSAGKSGTLRVGVRADLMNFSYLNETTGKYYGLEIDLAYKLADILGYKDVVFTTVTPDDRKQMLLDGKVDCLIAAYSVSESRLKNFDFSVPYYEDRSRIMVEKTSLIEDMYDLIGKDIGVLDGADTAPVFAVKMNELGLIPDLETETILSNINYVRFQSYSDLAAALEDGTVDAACMDGCIAQAYKNDDRMFLEETLSDENYGVATQKGSALSKSVADGVQKLLDDGTIETLIDKWD